ncbi:MAG: S1C family serine protease [Chthoniobacterales bacterium]
MKTKILALLAGASLLPALGFAQNPPPVPPVPPTSPALARPGAPPVPPQPEEPERDRDRAPKVPITFLGVETSEVPNVVAEQLGLAKGFGLVVDYVVPDGPAAAAGVQQNDILKMLNDQILVDPDQLAKLIRSYSEGTSISLTVLRKGAETKLNAKLGKREVPQRRNTRPWRDGKGFGVLGPEFEKSMGQLNDQLGNANFAIFDRDAANEMRESAHAAQESAREVEREAREQAREATRAAREAARAFRVTRSENGALKTTHIDMNRAQIVYHDTGGELRIENVAGKKVLTAKDPQGRLVFSGPVETKEDLDKVPAEVRQRYDKLEQKDLPSLAPSVTREDESADSDEEDNDDDDSDSAGTSILQVTNICPAPSSSSSFSLNIVLI